MKRHTTSLVLLVGIALPALGDDTEPAKRQPDNDTNSPALVAMSRAEAQMKTMQALREKFPSPQQADEILEPLWSSSLPTLDAIGYSVLESDQEVATWLDGLLQKQAAPLPSMLASVDGDPFLGQQLKLFAGRELVRSQRLDEALTLLDKLEPKEVVDPAALHFQRGICLYYLHRTEHAKRDLGQLDRIEDVPLRYRAMAQSMLANVDRLEPKSLDGIAHDMRDVKRRLALGRTGKRVQAIEKDVLDRLDNLIEDLEKQRQQQQSSSSAGGAPSGTPMQDSQRAGASGEGKVNERRFKEGDSWGNLPDKERQRIMQELGRDYPGHYRDAIEEYFRRLAREEDAP
ncbi:hypothetical protein Pan216_19730 [Planctomycetes bacterium Pan216]|uniref:Tetratricopeptide repeat protein n=1 Tax=Kolteria novifilia TaxID=2527975 RepID=A0A518B2A9_9BACT|nr:hypothetical protein Pan216_19730 [Planctomycetes bacterium Pan216]